MQEKKSILMIGGKETASFMAGASLDCGPFRFVYQELGAGVLDRIVAAEPVIVMVCAERSNRSVLDLCAGMRSLYGGLIVLCMDYEDEQDQILAYQMGVDDIILQPTSPRLLVARLDALLRRLRFGTGAMRPESITVGDLRIDAGRREAFLRGHPLHLTSIQYDLLLHLVQHAGKTVTRDNLCRALFDTEYNGVDRAIDVYVSRIRHKLRDNPRNPAYVKTVRGIGYLFAGA